MDWTTLLASLSGSVDEDRLRRNQQPAPRRHGRGFASAIGLSWMRLGAVTHVAQGGCKGRLPLQDSVLVCLVTRSASIS